MGFDVYGRAPDGEVGRYFRANIWHWPPILDAIAQTGVLEDELCEAMSYNESAGPDGVKARELADALSDLLKRSEEPVPSSPGISAVQGASAVAAWFGADLGFPFDAEMLGRFVDFCRQSGGFRVT
jgi:hypothetical protein